MSARPSMGTTERRARLARRHHLAAAYRVDSPWQVARDLVALHGTDPASVFLSMASRLSNPSVGDIERALYDDRVLVRMLGMRRTMFVVADELAPVIQAACTRAIAAQLRRRYEQLLERAGVADDVPTFVQRVCGATVAALERRGEATAQELARDVPELRTQIRLAEGKTYAGTVGLATWILMLLSAEGHVVRGRPRGSWTSSQYRWAPIDHWLTNGLPPLETFAAQVALVREWLGAFGPGTLEDLKWWTGLTVAEVRRALASIDVVEVDLGGYTGMVSRDDTETVGACEPWVTFLPALDATPMGYAQRGWYLGEHAAALFDRSGNIGPTVWSDGRIVGGWAQRNNGCIAYRLLEDLGSDCEQRVATAAHELEGWLGSVRVTPRFRTPLERELSA